MSSALRVLVIEDDVAILKGVSMNLRFEGYEVLQAQDGRQGLTLALDEHPDLVVLDLMLPSLNGYEVLQALRERGSDVPVLLLTAKGLETDKVRGFQLGADDYVVKPFGLQELLARVRALLRRRSRGAATAITFGDVVVDLDAKSVARALKAVDITAQEFRLLEYFVKNPGRTFDREALLQGAWGLDYEGTDRTVDNFVRQLRLKLEPDPDAPKHFVTARGLGYRFEP